MWGNKFMKLLQTNLFRMIAALMLIGLIAIAIPNTVLAACTTYNARGPSSSITSADEECMSGQLGGSLGTAVYSCANYPLPEGGSFYDCYAHDFYCDTPCNGGGGGCFVPGTLVGNKSEGKKIEDVKVGDKVTSFKDDKIVNSSVSKIYKIQRNYYPNTKLSINLVLPIITAIESRVLPVITSNSSRVS